jgi:MoxR-like ATPase
MSDEFVKKANLILQKLRQHFNQSMVLDKWLVDQLLISLLNQGHVLLEAAPGLGKTTLVKVISRLTGLDYQRVQCTPDLMPSDVTGANVFNPKTQEFELHKGPIFTQLLLVDEINRTSPRTQSALLQAMAEKQVTLDRHTHSLDEHFWVMATQNPIEFSGTYPLPEAQLDRFFIKLKLAYPSSSQLKNIARINLQQAPDEGLKPLINPKTLSQLQGVVNRVSIKEEVIQYTADLCEAITKHPDIRIGVSPRGCVALIKAAKCYALLQQRNFVTPDDILIMAAPILSHRLVSVRDMVLDKAFFQHISLTVPAPHTGQDSKPESESVKAASLSLA